MHLLLCLGSGYNNASVSQTGGSPTTPAKITPIFAPRGGLGHDPRADLRSNGVMLTVKPDGTENNDFIVGNDFRQVGLVRNMLDSASGVKFTASTGIALKQLVFASGGSTFTADKVMVGTSSTAKGIIDKVDGNNIWYHQNDETGYRNFEHDEAVTENGGSGSGQLVNNASTYLVNPEVGTTTGDLLYIDNRAAVSRAADQTEDIKIVIQI